MQELDTLSKYGQSFQSKVLSALLVDGKFLDTISEITTSKFFENDANKWIISEILEYHSEYKKPPTLDVFKSLPIHFAHPLPDLCDDGVCSKTPCSLHIILTFL